MLADKSGVCKTVEENNLNVYTRVKMSGFQLQKYDCQGFTQKSNRRGKGLNWLSGKTLPKGQSNGVFLDIT